MRARPPLLVAAPRRAVALLAVLSALLLAGVVSPPPAAAATRDVRLTQDGPVPAQLTVAAGDSVRFVNVDSFVHRAVSASSGWAFDTGPLVPGEAFVVEPALTRPGTYAYRGAGLDSFTGSVVVPGQAEDPAPSPGPSSAAPVVPVPAPSRTPEPQPSSSTPPPTPAPSGSAGPAPVATGGTGVAAGPPPLAGGSFGGFGVPATPVPGAPAPLVAPGQPLPVGAVEDGGALVQPEAADAPTTTTTAVGPPPVLRSPVEARRYGLPLALAAVLLAGVGSLLVRLLLAEAPAGVQAPGPASA